VTEMNLNDVGNNPDYEQVWKALQILSFYSEQKTALLKFKGMNFELVVKKMNDFIKENKDTTYNLKDYLSRLCRISSCEEILPELKFDTEGEKSDGN
jgi:hypothetical protein